MASASGRWLDVELRHIDLSYDERPVLRDLAWRIRPGERWVLVGGNGAGKTQLLKMVAGDIWPTPGDFAAPPAVRRYRWQGELQDLAGGVKEEIAYLGPERQDRYERYDWNFPADVVVGTGVQRADIPQGPLTAAAQARVAALMKRLDIGHLAQRPFLTLSYGERRLVLLARALASRPALLLLDEITNGLDTTNRARFQAWLKSSARSAMPWVLTTHRAEDVPASATHLAVLREGALTWRGRLTPRALAQAFREPGATPLQAPPAAARRRRQAVAAGPLLQLRKADVHLEDAQLLHRIDLTVNAGECWVIHGRNGAGKSTLLRTLWGDYPVAVGGRIHRADIGEDEGIPEWRQRVGYITPQLQADHPQNERVIDVVGSGLHASIGLNQPLTAAEQRRSLQALEDFGLGELAERTLRQLSYGQLRRVLFARAWVTRPRLLLLDEPFAGVDTATREGLLARLQALQAQGVTLVLVSHHRNEWPAGTTHELELEQGRVVYGGPRRT